MNTTTAKADPKIARLGLKRKYRRKPLFYLAAEVEEPGMVETTRHGLVPVDRGDFIITNFKGEEYACPRDVFLASHEKAA